MIGLFKGGPRGAAHRISHGLVAAELPVLQISVGQQFGELSAIQRRGIVDEQPFRVFPQNCRNSFSPFLFVASGTQV